MIALLLAATLLPGAEPDPLAAIALGAEYLALQQGDDGAWHSAAYGSLHQGAAVTSLNFYAMATMPAEQRALQRKRGERAYAFLSRRIEAKGYVANPDGSPDYPTYSSALTLSAAQRWKLGRPAQLAQLERYLIGAQLAESRGFAPASEHYGGWDLLGATGLRGATTGTNISVSRFALQALTNANTAAQARDRGRSWAQRCQKLSLDGGFAFTPEPYSASNKAGLENDKAARPLSYGTATCDGLLCLLTSGAAMDSPEVKQAIAWLDANFQTTSPGGFSGDAPIGRDATWEFALRFYHYAALASVVRYLPHAEQRRRALVAEICGQQRGDGRWENTAARMREDDPLIATPLALIALNQLVSQSED